MISIFMASCIVLPNAAPEPLSFQSGLNIQQRARGRQAHHSDCSPLPLPSFNRTDQCSCEQPVGSVLAFSIFPRTRAQVPGFSKGK